MGERTAVSQAAHSWFRTGYRSSVPLVFRERTMPPNCAGSEWEDWARVSTSTMKFSFWMWLLTDFQNFCSYFSQSEAYLAFAWELKSLDLPTPLSSWQVLPFKMRFSINWETVLSMWNIHKLLKGEYLVVLIFDSSIITTVYLIRIMLQQ